MVAHYCIVYDMLVKVRLHLNDIQHFARLNPALTGWVFYYLELIMTLCLFSKASDFTGRLIAYGGGTGVFVFSTEVAAQAQAAANLAHQTPVGTLTISTVVSVGGLAVVFGRLAFDVFKYFDQRKKRKRGEQDDQQYLD